MVGLLISINFGALNLKLIYTFVRFKIKGNSMEKVFSPKLFGLI